MMWTPTLNSPEADKRIRSSVMEEIKDMTFETVEEKVYNRSITKNIL